MYNPFPGMNPYLEQLGLWSQVHNRLIVAIADEITPQVARKYRVSSSPLPGLTVRQTHWKMKTTV